MLEGDSFLKSKISTIIDCGREEWSTIQLFQALGGHLLMLELFFKITNEVTSSTRQKIFLLATGYKTCIRPKMKYNIVVSINVVVSLYQNNHCSSEVNGYSPHRRGFSCLKFWSYSRIITKQTFSMLTHISFLVLFVLLWHYKCIIKPTCLLNRRPVVYCNFWNWVPHPLSKMCKIICHPTYTLPRPWLKNHYPQPSTTSEHLKLKAFLLPLEKFLSTEFPFKVYPVSGQQVTVCNCFSLFFL